MSLSFAIACRDLRSLRDRDKFGTWLGGICRNVTKQMLRVKTRTAPLPGRDADGDAGYCVSADEPEQEEQWDIVRKAVWKLPEAERELVVMRYFNGFSQPRISQVLDLTLTENQDIVVAMNAAPYDFNRDENLPKELKTRIQSMIDALKAKDGAARVANYNIHYVYKLAKGQVAYDPNLFGGTAEDAQNLQKGLVNVASPEELARMVASSLHSNGGEIYITSITMNKAGDHASARCVSKNGDRTVVLGPQWHNFDGGWRQVDD